MTNKCYDCKHRGKIPGDAHSYCKNKTANVKGHECGRKNGWFMWPFNFDPTWLLECDGFEESEYIRKAVEYRNNKVLEGEIR